MDSWQHTCKSRAKSLGKAPTTEAPAAAICLQIVDACLIGIVLVAPLFLGGRPPVGRFLFVVIACLASVAWFTHQTLRKRARWTRTWAYLIGLAALLLVMLQLVPLPADWIGELAPRNRSILSLWSTDADNSLRLGDWSTLSYAPSLTKMALATLVAYVLLFATTVQRLETLSDVERLLRLIGLSAILMSCFGLIQYFTSNGMFFWFHEHPFTTTDHAVKGSFSCRNHFAHFLVLGLGPLLAWIVLRLQKQKQESTEPGLNKKLLGVLLYLGLCLLILAVLLSFSRGGAVALAFAGTIGLTCYYRHGLISSSFLFGLVFLAVFIIGVLSIYGYDRVAGRLNDFATGSIDQLDNGGGRRKIWAANLAAAQQGSAFGAGAGSHREIYPIYLPESLNQEYTHAENGYLQIATECGYLGVFLLVVTLAFVGQWCWKAVRRAMSVRQLVSAVAVSSGLAASALHSVVDFVWFIPACMSMTILLCACALRLAQLTSETDVVGRVHVPWPRRRWAGMAVTASLASAWAISVMVGPARASSYWDRYLITSRAQRKETSGQLNSFEESSEAEAKRLANAEVIVFNLRQVLAYDPGNARANIRLAGRCLDLFEIRRRRADNSMSIDQIRDTAIASQFDSAQELRDWLYRAFGENSKLLYQAYAHTQKSLKLCPLQAKAYLYLAQLSYLTGQSREVFDECVDQSLKIRPYDADVLYLSGLLLLEVNQPDSRAKALDLWRKSYVSKGNHQLKIIRLLVKQVPAAAFLETFQPSWNSLAFIWRWYRHEGNLEDWQNIAAYGANAAQRECPGHSPKRAAQIWQILSRYQQGVDDLDGSLASLRRAIELAPGEYGVRRKYGQALLKAERYDLAEPHLRWCLARKPDDRGLHRELVLATKGNTALTTGVESVYR